MAEQQLLPLSEKPSKKANFSTSTAFLRELHDSFPNKIIHILADNALQCPHYKGEKNQHILKTWHRTSYAPALPPGQTVKSNA